MDAIEARLGPLYSVLLGLVALGSCLQLGPEGTTWDSGGAAAVFVIAVGLMLAWAAAVPQRQTWPLGVLAGTALVGVLVVAQAAEHGSYPPGAQLVILGFVLAAVVALGHLAAVYNLTGGPARAGHRSQGAP